VLSGYLSIAFGTGNIRKFDFRCNGEKIFVQWKPSLKHRLLLPVGFDDALNDANASIMVSQLRLSSIASELTVTAGLLLRAGVARM
jgi:hypothetical protein